MTMKKITVRKAGAIRLTGATAYGLRFGTIC